MSAPSKIIGGRSFAFGMMPADIATEVEVVIAGAAADAIVNLVTAQGLDEEAQAKAMGAALGSLTSGLGKLGPGKTTELMRTVFRFCTIETAPGQGIPVDLVRDFTGKPKDKWLVLFEALKVNFADFFGGAPLPSIGAPPPQA